MHNYSKYECHKISLIPTKKKASNFLASNFHGHIQPWGGAKSLSSLKNFFLQKHFGGKRQTNKKHNHMLLHFFPKAVKLLSFAEVSQV